jgi:uncharacterized protein with HEPN domain
MSPEERDLAYIWDMLEYANKVVEIIAGQSKHNWHNNPTIRLAIERGLEIIGEAARHVSETLRAQHPEIPWQDIIGQRNILAHDYGNIDYDLLYETAVQDIPALIAQLQDLLPPAEDDIS